MRLARTRRRDQHDEHGEVIGGDFAAGWHIHLIARRRRNVITPDATHQLFQRLADRSAHQMAHITHS